MGTNFYLTRYYYKYNDEYQGHIGKRSAAGLYCWDCNITLCMSGNNGIHYSHSGFFDKCPKCGQAPSDEKLQESSSGMELGFVNKHKIVEKKGVRGCSSFTWAKHPDEVKKSKVRYVYDEYGERFTKKEFLNMIEKSCPVQFFHSIGQCFS